MGDCRLFRRETPQNTGQLIFCVMTGRLFSPCSAAKFRREIRKFGGGISRRNSALIFIFYTISPRNFTISRAQISR